MKILISNWKTLTINNFYYTYKIRIRLDNLAEIAMIQSVENNHHYQVVFPKIHFGMKEYRSISEAQRDCDIFLKNLGMFIFLEDTNLSGIA